MHHANRYDGFDRRVLRHIRGTARLLARTDAVPGMAYEDFEQDLIVDLWRRSGAFDPARSEYPTFADRVVAHRVGTLTCPTARLQAERQAVSLDALADAANDGALGESQLPIQEHEFGPDVEVGMRLDVSRFVAGLSPALRRCCEILMSGNIAAAAAEAGLHRSSAYEGMQRLRRLAELAGLAEYIGRTPTLSDSCR